MQWPSLWSWVGAPVASALVFQTAAAKLCRAGCPLPGDCCLCCKACLVRETSISVMDVVSYQKHSCVSCGLLALAFHLFELWTGAYILIWYMPCNAFICYIPSPSPFVLWGQLCSLCQQGWFPFSPLLLSIPHPLKGSGTGQQLCSLPRLFIHRASLPMQSCWHSWEERPSVSAMTATACEDSLGSSHCQDLSAVVLSVHWQWGFGGGLAGHLMASDTMALGCCATPSPHFPPAWQSGHSLSPKCLNSWDSQGRDWLDGEIRGACEQM